MRKGETKKRVDKKDRKMIEIRREEKIEREYDREKERLGKRV